MIFSLSSPKKVNSICKLGYGQYQFNRTDIKCGSYGGRKTANEKIVNKPIIFLHGNSDVAFGRGTQDGYAEWQTGFRSLAAYFTASGYKKS
jgi:triacylglycerol lipase